METQKKLRENLSSHFASNVAFVLLKYGVPKQDLQVNSRKRDSAEVRLFSTEHTTIDEIESILRDEDYKVFPANNGNLLVAR
jgi:hypothetical protein